MTIPISARTLHGDLQPIIESIGQRFRYGGDSMNGDRVHWSFKFESGGRDDFGERSEKFDRIKNAKQIAFVVRWRQENSPIAKLSGGTGGLPANVKEFR